MKIERLDHFGIEVADLRRAGNFYTQVLGLDMATRLGGQVLLDRRSLVKGGLAGNRAGMAY